MVQKYTIFGKYNRIVVTNSPNEVKKYGESIVIECDKDWEKLTDISSFWGLKSHKQNIFFITDKQNLKKVFEHLLSCFFFVKAAGGVVKKCNSEEILFIFRDGVWDLPKGHVENGETDSTAAIREVQEETGISGKIVSQEPYLTYHYYFMNGRWELKQTAWYRMESTDCVFKPQAEEGITDIRWVNPLELNEVLMNTYPNIRELMRVMISGL